MKALLLEVMKPIADKIPQDPTYSVYFTTLWKHLFAINRKNIPQNVLFFIQQLQEKLPALPNIIKKIVKDLNGLPFVDVKNE